MYYTLNPPSPPLPSDCPTPISLLEKITSIHPASTLMFYQTIPTHERNKLDVPYWFRWAEGVDLEGQEYKAIVKHMKRAEKEGVWGLLWDIQGETFNIKGDKDKRKERRIRRRGESDEEEEEEEERGGIRRRQVGNSAWILLEWLVDLWEQDQEANEGTSQLLSLEVK